MASGADAIVPSIALVTTRDGVVGAWQPQPAPTMIVPGPSIADHWDHGPRLHMYLTEVVCGLSFDAQGGSVAVEHRDRAATARTILVHMIRPEQNDFVAQLEYVRNYAALRAERIAEIAEQLGNLVAFLGGVCGLHPTRHAHTLEVLAVASLATQIVEMRVKHELACRRPFDYSPQIQPMIQTPGHGSLPSGHATEAFTAALLLEQICRAARATTAGIPARSISDGRFVQLMRIAERMAINRTVAGVHFPVDSAAGMVLARSLSEYFIARFAGTGDVYARTFDGRGFTGDFHYEEIWEQSEQSCGSGAAGSPKICRSDQPVAIPKSELLAYLWAKAVDEWK